MKKSFKYIISSIVIIYALIQVFNYYNSTHILGNQAAFNVYLDPDESKIDSFFEVKKGTFDKEKHIIICELPVKRNGFKTKSVIVSSDITHIDCNRVFNNQVDTKYDNSELDENYFKLAIIKRGFPVAMFDSEMAVMVSTIITYKNMKVKYTRGEINNIVISADSAYVYCPK